jgi:aspartyl-tRNA(Asn)/glutamyl-tRNA(Gln) amidotransferase subunit A
MLNQQDRHAQVQPALQNRRSFLCATAAAAGLTLRPASADPQDPAALTLKAASALLRRKAVSSVELTQACLHRIDRYNSALNAFITITGEQALKSARDMDSELRRGKFRGALHGIPVALKDNIATAGIRTTAASELFKDNVPSEDAEAVRKLKLAGAVILGKLNLQEFAYGGTSDVSYFGAVHNPWALDHISGGSSGGSAAAVAADLCFGALGTDTGGSIRIPSSYCGVAGLKATYGRVSLRGVIPLSWTLDHCGPICRTVEDTSLMLQAIAGYGQLDPASVDVPIPAYGHAFELETSKLRLGIPRSPFFENLDPEVANATEAGLAVLRKITTHVADVSLLQSFPATFPLFLTIVGPEALAYHAKSVVEFPNRYQPLTRERLTQAINTNAAAYAGALHQTYLVRREIKSIFSSIDLLVTPTMPKPAETFAESKSFDQFGLQNTSPFDVYGLPAITVPCGFTSSGLPIGLQIAGAPWAEETILALAHAYERETEWHKSRPKLSPA